MSNQRMDTFKGSGKGGCLLLGLMISCLLSPSLVAAPVAQTPLFLTQGVEPQVMLSMSNDHQLFFEAYPDYLDLDGDGSPNTTYSHNNDYYGYFDSYKCYDYSTAKGYFEPKASTDNKYCDAVSGEWSGNFLNYISMSRMDIVRKILFGGYRRQDSSTLTVLERAYIPTEAHSWSRFYNGSDMNKLTPFDNGSVKSASASGINSGNNTIGTGSKTFNITGTGSADFMSSVEVGDQVILSASGLLTPLLSDPGTTPIMAGRITNRDTSRSRVTVDVKGTNESGRYDNWSVLNPSRAGISFCNTTNNSSLSGGDVVPDTRPPRMSVARGNYGLWSSNERWQCRWSEEVGAENQNNIGITEFAANASNPRRNVVGLGNNDYNVRVEVCNEDLLGTERCKEYPSGNYKPVGLLQQYGDDDQIFFGLLSGSYLNNKSGGVLRKNISAFGDELNVGTDGTFKDAPTSGGIVSSLNLLRMYGYGTNGVYTRDSENCSFQLPFFEDGRCVGWGNPQSEIFMEAIRYFSGSTSTEAFSEEFPSNGRDLLAGLQAQPWTDPLSDQNYCAPLNIINFNGSVASYDRDQLDTVTDLPGISSVAGLRSITDTIGLSEGVNGNNWFIGESGSSTNQLCTSKTVGSLANAIGLCPEAPRLSGGYDVVGLAHHAYIEDMRTDLQDAQNIRTFAVALAPAVPRIDIPRPGSNETTVTILPACRNASIGGNCALVDFKVVRQDRNNGTGKFLVNWEDSEQGGDYDQDMYGTIEYIITDSTLEVITRVGQESTSGRLGFGYVLNGTTKNGFHAHSGIEGFRFDDSTGATDCSTGCNLNDPETSYTYALQSGGADSNLLEAPMFYAAKWSGYDKQADFPNDQDSWDADGDGLPDNYYFAIDPSKLADDLEKVFADILRTAASAASVAANSSSLSTETSVYQASFNSQNWSGDLRAFEINDDGTLADTFSWSAAKELDDLTPGQIITRKIITNTDLSLGDEVSGELLSSTGITFEWDELTEDQKTALQKNRDGTTASSAIAESRLEYLRGDRSKEKTLDEPTGIFRERLSRLGDIINSNPQYIYRQNFGYGGLAGISAFSDIDGYNDFRASDVYLDRVPMVVVGSNDGMLHGFDATPDATNAGRELFAYVPSGVVKNLHELTELDYQHRYYVDGTVRIADAWLGGSEKWATLAVGSTGAGGNSIFALDITDPENVGTDQFLWEFTHPDMGNTIQQPSIVALPSGEFGVVVTSGYKDVPDVGGGKVWILNAETGRPIETFELPGSAELGSPLVVDLTGDRIADRVYVGDTDGNLWRIDLESGNSNAWGVPVTLKQGSTLLPLFSAPDGQSITAPLSSAFNNDGEHMVFFGTGSFYRVGQNVIELDPQIESFYGIIDRGNELQKGDLLEQEIIAEVVENSQRFRFVSDNPITNTYDGWYIDLLWKESLGGEGAKGERAVTRALVRGDRVIFATLIPSDDPCAAGGNSFLIEVDTSSGSRLAYSVFDTNGDGVFDDNDFIIVIIDGEEVSLPASGLAPEIGIINSPTVLTGVGESSDETKVISGSSGQVITIQEAGSRSRGRQNWEQLQ
jgi:type IV pilus assembly protein PilY1